MLVYRVTGGSTNVCDPNGVGILPVTDEAVPNIRGKLSRFATGVPLDDPGTLPVANRVRQANLRLFVKRLPHSLTDPDGPMILLLQKKINN